MLDGIGGIADAFLLPLTHEHFFVFGG